jgi:hypothetical protein
MSGIRFDNGREGQPGAARRPVRYRTWTGKGRGVCNVRSGGSVRTGGMRPGTSSIMRWTRRAGHDAGVTRRVPESMSTRVFQGSFMRQE